VNVLRADGPKGMFSTGARRPPGGPVEFDHPSRTYRGDGRCGSYTLHRSKLIRYPDAPRNRSTRASPRGTGFGTGFSHTVEFSRNVTGLLFGRLARGSRVNLSAPERRDGTTGLSRSSKTSHLSGKRTPAGVPPATSTRHTEAPPRRPLHLGARTATEQPLDRLRLVLGDLLSSVADAAGVVPERSSVMKNFPACSPVKVAPCSTACQLRGGPEAKQHNGFGRPVYSRRGLRAWRRLPAGAGGQGRGGRPSADARPARPAARCARTSRPAGRRAAPRPG